MSAAKSKSVDEIGVPEPTCRNTAAHALTIVRDGVMTGEGPTTRGRVHFSRALDADDAAWCARILTANAVEHQPVSRAEAEALFAINDAASERSDDGRFDDLLAKAVAHHAAAESGLKVPPRTVALSPDTDIESWAPNHATAECGSAGVDREPDARQAAPQPHADDDGRDASSASPRCRSPSSFRTCSTSECKRVYDALS